MSTVGETLIGDVSVFVDNYNRLERRCSELESSKLNAERFYAVPLGVEVVAKLHGVSPYLVREYIKLGLIHTHPSSTDAKILIRGSEALMLDFHKMKEKAKSMRLRGGNEPDTRREEE